ncbi:hypothetical protein NUM3379_22910 [Kineococcus sp. NUM-3379]
MGGSQHYHTGRAASHRGEVLKVFDAASVGINRQVQHCVSQAPPGFHHCGQAGVFHRDLPHAEIGGGDGLGRAGCSKARADDDAVGVSVHAPHPGEVGGQLGAQHLGSGPIRRAGGRVAPSGGTAQGADPATGRERTLFGLAGTQIERARHSFDPVGWLGGSRAQGSIPDGGSMAGDVQAATAASGKDPFGDEVVEGGDHRGS